MYTPYDIPNIFIYALGGNNPLFDNSSDFLRQDNFNNYCCNRFGETCSPYIFMPTRNSCELD